MTSIVLPFLPGETIYTRHLSSCLFVGCTYSPPFRRDAS